MCSPSFSVKQMLVLKYAALFLDSFVLFKIWLKVFFLLKNFEKNLFDFTPGLSFRAFMQIPESSAKQGILNNINDLVH